MFTFACAGGSIEDSILNLILNKVFQGWRGCSAVRSTGWSSRGSGFSSHHPHHSSQPSPVPGTPIPSSDLSRHQAYTWWHTYIHVSKALIHVKHSYMLLDLDVLSSMSPPSASAVQSGAGDLAVRGIHCFQHCEGGRKASLTLSTL